MISSWVRKVISMVMTYISLGTLQGAATSAAWWLEFPWCSSCQHEIGPGFLLLLDIFFNMYLYYSLAPGSYAACCPWP